VRTACVARAARHGGARGNLLADAPRKVDGARPPYPYFN
jgi:hypothetical protein